MIRALPSGRCCPGLVILAALLSAPPALAQAPSDAAQRFAFETHVFRRMLFDQRLAPLASFQQLREQVSQNLIIVLGKTDCLNSRNLPGGLAEFVAHGGSALVATDQAPGFDAQEMLRVSAGVQVMGEHLLGPETDAAIYRGKAFCPVLIPVRDAEPDLFHGPRLDPTAQLRVATNVPSWLRIVEQGLPADVHPLAILPPGCSPDLPPADTTGERNQVPWQRIRPVFARVFPARRDREPLFAVGGTVSDGRILVLADHSIFINQMMLPADTGNVEFTYNALEWLRSDKQRTRVLLVQDGVIRTDLDVPLKDVPLPQEAVAVTVDHVLTHLEHENTLNRTVWEWLLGRSGGNTDRIARWALEALTTAVLVYAAYRVMVRSRHRLDTTVPLLAHAAAGHAPAVPLLQQRYEAARRAGNLWETAHHLARQWFTSVAPTATGPHSPRIAVRGGWWRRFRVRHRFARLWRLAHTTDPVPVGPRRLRRVIADLHGLKAALADGTLQIKG
jgi:hypothetical protein